MRLFDVLTASAPMPARGKLSHNSQTLVQDLGRRFLSLPHESLSHLAYLVPKFVSCITARRCSAFYVNDVETFQYLSRA